MTNKYEFKIKRDNVKLELVDLTETAKNAEQRCRDMIAEHTSDLDKRDAATKKKKDVRIFCEIL